MIDRWLSDSRKMGGEWTIDEFRESRIATAGKVVGKIQDNRSAGNHNVRTKGDRHPKLQ
jgi:hypothetical protein